MIQQPFSTSLRHTGLSLALAMAAMLLAGCESAHVAKPLTHEMGGDDPDMQLNFWHTLAERPVTSNDEAFHGLLLFLDGKDPSTRYTQRVFALKARKMLPESFDEPGNDAVKRGTLAVSICQVLKIKGGMMMHVVGPTPRYAVRELVYAGVYPPSSPNQTFSGSEYLGIIGRMEDRQQASSVEVPASVLPGETKPATTRPAK